jgi:hypothetical protein
LQFFRQGKGKGDEMPQSAERGAAFFFDHGVAYQGRGFFQKTPRFVSGFFRENKIKKADGKRDNAQNNDRKNNE